MAVAAVGDRRRGKGRSCGGLAALALLLASTGASAQAPAPPPWNPKAPENTQLLATFNYATIETVLKSIGATFRRTGTNPARPSLLVTFRNGRRAVLALSACDDSGASCKAMNVQTTWSRVAGAAPERTSQSIAQFNRRYAYAKAFLIGDGQPTLQRYLTADYGYVRGNLAVDLLVFADQAQRFTIEVLQPLQKAAK